MADASGAGGAGGIAVRRERTAPLRGLGCKGGHLLFHLATSTDRTDHLVNAAGA